MFHLRQPGRGTTQARQMRVRLQLFTMDKFLKGLDRYARIIELKSERLKIERRRKEILQELQELGYDEETNIDNPNNQANHLNNMYIAYDY